jgi:hypothetical protein
MSSKKTISDDSNYWLVSWDILGLEALIDLTEFLRHQEEWDKEKTWKSLKDEKMSSRRPEIPLKMMLMRARCNTQRYYEMYTFKTDIDIDETTIREWFDTSPQTAADWIRKNGNKIYGEGIGKAKALIR